MISVGRLIPLKGFLDLISAIAEFDNLELEIIGDGPQKIQLRKHIIELGLAGRVRLLGRLPPKRVFDHLQHSDIFVLNSSGENFPHVLLEAMHARIPIISTNVGGCSEAIEHLQSGYLIEPGSLRGLVAALDYLVSNPDIANEFANQAYFQVTRKFNYGSMLNDTTRVIFDG